MRDFVPVKIQLPTGTNPQIGMKLFLADYHLEAGRLCLAEKKKNDAKNHFNTAKEMINNMGYHRRDKEVSAWNDE
ncbi:MAG: hypothetical protein JSV88_25435 [Candidatus Aminicenantes bacterium]|nr:MAG: hypothetical protein JSV88_25435 [Candidatus Aminicenantes bacterium]